MEFLDNFKKLINTDITPVVSNNKMSVTFTKEEVEQLEDAICNSEAKRSFSSHKKDLHKFILAYFEKQRTKGSKKKSKSKSPTGKKNETNKSSGKKKKKETSEKKSKELKGPKNGYKILKVSKNYEFPSSIYKKDDPDAAAKSAMKGIIRKNELDDDITFTFSIITGGDTYKYTCKSGKLEAH